jgi:hypothetical protein
MVCVLKVQEDKATKEKVADMATLRMLAWGFTAGALPNGPLFLR